MLVTLLLCACTGAQHERRRQRGLVRGRAGRAALQAATDKAVVASNAFHLESRGKSLFSTTLCERTQVHSTSGAAREAAQSAAARAEAALQAAKDKAAQAASQVVPLQELPRLHMPTIM